MPSRTKVSKDEATLTLKQTAFCRAYVEDAQGNATAAARAAGYKGNDRTLSVVGYENLRKPNVQNFISDLQQTRERRFNQRLMSSAEVLGEIGAIAKAPWQDFVEVKCGKRGEVLRVRIRLADKMKALDLMGRYYKLWDRGYHGIEDDEEKARRVLAKLIGCTPAQLPPANPLDVEGELLEVHDEVGDREA